ncbi:hypothetical protein [Flavobacterium undicola]|uniref:hypothetical protein n=1 Tax=Flavobacterium undicola TaxID=1932779 RepID=UPI00137669AE|nr:hypothetical protein [Flavobacterium undicola]MBA0882230.1 hypothetical protein [Flavobacterium undicola]
MRNGILFFVFASFFSCKKEVPNSSLISKNFKDSIEIKINEAKVIQTDTLKLEKSKTLNGVDKILIATLKKEINKDSITKELIRFDFFNKNNNLVKSISSSITHAFDNGSWYTSENVFSQNKSDNRFIELSYGYDACGYTQTNFLFFIETNHIQLITKNESMADGGYGTWTSFEPNFKDNKLISFSSTIIQVDTDESKPYNDLNEDLVINYSDSIVYNWISNKWLGELKSKKGKIFRKEFKKFNDVYKSE